MRNVLFICSQNRLRSPTAEEVFSDWPNIETDSAGLDAQANVPLSSEQVEWADLIFVMEKTHRKRLSTKFRPYLRNKQIICLDIPDDYDFMQPELINLLLAKVSRFLT